MEIDRDRNVSEEMARTLLREHQGIEFPGDIPWFLQSQRPAPPAKAKQGNLEVPPEEPFGLHSWESLRAVYQVLHEEMQQELEQDRLFFLENPNRVHMVRGAFPIEARFLREQAQILEGPGTIPDGKMLIVVRCIAPGLRLRLRLPPGMADDEDHSRHMWERCTGESPDNGAIINK